MTEELDDIRKALREVESKNATLEERVKTLTKIVKTHEHDARDGCTKFDVGYL